MDDSGIQVESKGWRQLRFGVVIWQFDLDRNAKARDDRDGGDEDPCRVTISGGSPSR